MHVPAHTGPHGFGAPVNIRAGYAGYDFVLRRLHEWAGYTLILLAAVHLLYNRKPLLKHFVKRR